MGVDNLNLNKGKQENVDEYYERILKEGYVLKTEYQGIRLTHIRIVLNRINQYTDDIRDTIWCLLNNEFLSLFPNADNMAIADGASVAHIGGYIGILMRHSKKLDREGRDYWIKPLRALGIVEEITFRNGSFLAGHLKAKSPHSCYRLNSDFIYLLQSLKNPDFENIFSNWINQTDQRLQIYTDIVINNQEEQEISDHKQLILDSINIYSKYFLPGYFPVFTDFEDGNRVTTQERLLLDKYGIVFGRLSDVWPDVILINEKQNALWFIEAVTTDGEVDFHKMKGLHNICKNSNMSFGGATTTYQTWKRCAARQHKEHNLCKNSFVWIKEDPTLLLNIC